MSATTLADTGTYLSFRLGNEDFAAEIAKVKEVLEYPVITKVPRMPGYVCGVTNLRGSVVPVVDMRLKFGMSQIERTVDTCVIILEVSMGEETLTIGCLVDSVREVFEMDASRIEPPPRMGTCINADFLKGMGALDEGFLMILDIDKVLSAEELLAMAGAAEFARSTDQSKVTEVAEAAAEVAV
ncbi:MAG TPA: chemotaxis protein CheW [Armatimonadetes bacterium]|jgi:purine-binding chemotaxis protein CheW|nr:chemotaxis protein CheW [Armatimonadota bacterium]